MALEGCIQQTLTTPISRDSTNDAMFCYSQMFQKQSYMILNLIWNALGIK